MGNHRGDTWFALTALVLLGLILLVTWTDEREADQVRAELKACQEKAAVLEMQQAYWRAR